MSHLYAPEIPFLIKAGCAVANALVLITIFNVHSLMGKITRFISDVEVEAYFREMKRHKKDTKDEENE